MKVTVKLDTFEGPLDLLLHLIDQAEVDIYDIPIKEITDQYMEYLDAMQELELEVTSEFLVMAATLLSIKSRMLLPKPPVLEMEFDDYMMDDDYDPRAELVAKLIEYRKYKAIAEHLRDKEVERSLIFTREPEDLTPYVPTVPENPVKGLHISDLVQAFRKAMRRMQSRNTIAKIRKDEISVKDRMLEVVDALERSGGRMMFSKLLDAEVTKDSIVVTFLAMLELMKVKRIVCFQHKLFDDIVIEAREEGTANGFWANEISY
ncbi:segregation and condensation protein A [Paenibacillus allorhizosphaerae]|uniref:Segregation and condensation protein A n=1 Tax=Paenibacillus allorhizosphaerae TaxID=2849866 RepID=A0ABM8VHD4_9BACL|nr:segregation/condensation protein A [Paenibacillus allorhizosphaerae]CAG7641692.1 Segregation and condensation protein A [Paenibacillus allorhizosphaerae]